MKKFTVNLCHQSEAEDSYTFTNLITASHLFLLLKPLLLLHCPTKNMSGKILGKILKKFPCRSRAYKHRLATYCGLSILYLRIQPKNLSKLHQHNTYIRVPILERLVKSESKQVKLLRESRRDFCGLYLFS